MKRLLTIMTLICMVTFTAQAQKNHSKDKTSLPNKAQNYMDNNFKDAKVKSVYKDDGKDYKVRIEQDNKDYKLEFDKKGNIKEVKAKDDHGKVPDNVMHTNIRQYLKKNYPNHRVREWKVDGKYIEIELENGFEIVFDKDGVFIRIDR